MGIFILNGRYELTFYSRSVIILFALVWSVVAIIERVWYSEWLFEESYRTNIKAWHYWPIWILLFLGGASARRSGFSEITRRAF